MHACTNDIHYTLIKVKYKVETVLDDMYMQGQL